MTIRISDKIISIYSAGSWVTVGIVQNRILILKPQSHILEVLEEGYSLPYDFLSDSRLFHTLMIDDAERNVIYTLSVYDILTDAVVNREQNGERKLFLSFELMNKINNHGI